MPDRLDRHTNLAGAAGRLPLLAARAAQIAATAAWAAFVWLTGSAIWSGAAMRRWLLSCLPWTWDWGGWSPFAWHWWAGPPIWIVPSLLFWLWPMLATQAWIERKGWL